MAKNNSENQKTLSFINKLRRNYNLPENVLGNIKPIIDGLYLRLNNGKKIEIKSILDHLEECVMKLKNHPKLVDILRLVAFDPFGYSYRIATNDKLKDYNNLDEFVAFSTNAACEENAQYVYLAISNTDITRNENAVVILDGISCAGCDGLGTNAKSIFDYICVNDIDNNYTLQIIEAMSGAFLSSIAEDIYYLTCEISDYSDESISMLEIVAKTKSENLALMLVMFYASNKNGENLETLYEIIKLAAGEEDLEYIEQIIYVLGQNGLTLSEILKKIKDIRGQKFVLN